MTAASKIKFLPVSQIHRNPKQPRQHFDETLLKELAASIKQYGIIQPIEVREDTDNGGYEIVAGERRYRANQMAGNTTIRVSIITEADELKRFKRSVSENVNRADMTPLEEAHAFKRILDEEDGATEQTVAKDFGKTTTYVRLRVALLDLREEVAEQVAAGRIGTQAAVQIAALTRANQGAVLKKWARGEFESENQLVHFAYAVMQQQKQESLLVVEEMDEEKKQERVRKQRTTRSSLDRIERVRELVEAIAKTDPVELALALEGQLGSRLEQLDRVADAVAKARWQLRQAKAHAEAREIVANPDAIDTGDDEEQPAAPQPAEGGAEAPQEQVAELVS